VQPPVYQYGAQLLLLLMMMTEVARARVAPMTSITAALQITSKACERHAPASPTPSSVRAEQH